MAIFFENDPPDENMKFWLQLEKLIPGLKLYSWTEKVSATFTYDPKNAHLRVTSDFLKLFKKE